MAIRPSTPEIITVNSEDLQTQIRDLLPSQDGFGSELQASNVITPIIDLTAAAEGSGLPQYLQEAISFGSQTAFDVSNATTAIANAPGFYRVIGLSGLDTATASLATNFSMTDGSATKIVWQHFMPATTSNEQSVIQFDLVFFLAAGITLNAISNNAACKIAGSIRQVATGDGTLVQPNGFPL